MGTEAKWTLPTPPGTVTSSLQWIDTDGNPAGSTEISVNNPDGVGAAVSFTYTATGVDFGTGPVEISFDAKAPGGFPGTALHVRYNGNFFGAIQGSFNGTTFTTYTQSFELSQGFEGTDTFTLQFEFAMGAVPESGGAIIVDNIQILTNLPETGPTTTSIEVGSLISWVPTVAENFYQPQESSNGVTYIDLGPAFEGTDVSSIFDSEPAAFYQVVESAPVAEETAYNGGFETLATGDPEGWLLGGNQVPTLNTTDSNSGTNSMEVAAAATVADPEVPSYTAAVSLMEQNTTSATVNSGLGGPVVIPGKTYDFSFWFKQLSSGPGYVQQYSIEYLDNGGAVLAGSGFQTFSGAIGVWEQVTLSGLVAPAGTVAAKILIQGVTGALDGSAGAFLIDDISFETTGPGSSSVIPATVASAVEVSWPSVIGTSYQPQRSTTLGGWLDLGSPITGDGTVKTVYDSPLTDKQFYRVEF